MVLWQKESNDADAAYVDLFANNNKTDGFSEWNRKLRASNWKNSYLFKAHNPIKSNKTSDSIRNEGNAYFRMGQYVEAMEMYSVSLIFAEPGTDNVSFGYANRATCFMNMKLYDECLCDIELAVKANYPNMPKLTQRKNNCEQLKQKHHAKEPFEPKLSFNPHEKFPCMADVLAIHQNERFGRHMVAKCDIDVGQTVLVEENYVSLTGNVDRVQCYTCMQSMKNFIACSKCTDVMFCSEKCQNKNEIHQKFCGEAIHRMPNTIRFIAKSILLGVMAFPSANELMDFVDDVLSKRNTQLPSAANDPQSKYGMFLTLQPAKQETLDIQIVYQAFTALMSIPFVKNMFTSKHSQRFLMHLTGEHFLLISNNSFGGSLTDASTVGTVSTVLSLLNHACAPNLFNSTAGNIDVCISMRPIKKGEQLFVKYLCGDRTTRQRQDILMSQWAFLCKCDKCEPHCQPADRAKMRAELTNHCRELAMSKSKCETFLKQYGHLPWSEEMDQVLKFYTKHLLEDFPFF